MIPAGVEAAPRALEAIAGANVIVLGPGSLFTSLIAGLRVPGIAEAITASPALLVYVCNLITQDGETLQLDGDAHVRALVEVGGIRSPDVIVAHDGPLLVPPGLDRVSPPQRAVGRVVTGDLADPSAEWPAHDPARLGAILRRLA